MLSKMGCNTCLKKSLSWRTNVYANIFYSHCNIIQFRRWDMLLNSMVPGQLTSIRDTYRALIPRDKHPQMQSRINV